MNTESAIFWTLLLAAVFWLVLLFIFFRKIASREDMSVAAKAFWIVVVFMAPVLGLIAYFALAKRPVKRKGY